LSININFATETHTPEPSRRRPKVRTANDHKRPEGRRIADTLKQAISMTRLDEFAESIATGVISKDRRSKNLKDDDLDTLKEIHWQVRIALRAIYYNDNQPRLPSIRKWDTRGGAQATTLFG